MSLYSLTTCTLAGMTWLARPLRLLEDRLVSIEAPVGMEVIAYGANDRLGSQVDQKCAGLRLRRAVDRLPELQQVVQVPLQLFERATDTAVQAITLMPFAPGWEMVSRSSIRSSPSIRRETPPPRGLFGISAR